MLPPTAYRLPPPASRLPMLPEMLPEMLPPVCRAPNVLPMLPLRPNGMLPCSNGMLPGCSRMLPSLAAQILNCPPILPPYTVSAEDRQVYYFCHTHLKLAIAVARERVTAKKQSLLYDNKLLYIFGGRADHRPGDGP